jgi:hypothetical protein
MFMTSYVRERIAEHVAGTWAAVSAGCSDLLLLVMFALSACL